MRLQQTDAYALAKLMNDKISGMEMYLERQLAEECTEYAQSVFKTLRMKHGETPAKRVDVVNNMIEELSDVILCADIIYAYYVEKFPQLAEIINAHIEFKRNRIAERAKEKETHE